MPPCGNTNLLQVITRLARREGKGAASSLDDGTPTRQSCDLSHGGTPLNWTSPRWCHGFVFYFFAPYYYKEQQCPREGRREGRRSV